MFIISKHSALSSTRQDVFLILTASAAVPPRTQSAAQLPSLAPHDSKARLRAVTSSRDSWRSHVDRAHTAQRVQFFKHQTGNVGGRRGRSLPFSGGFKGGILFGKRIPPLVPRRARRSPSRARAGKSRHPFGKGCKKDPPHLWQVFFELISNNAYCGSYGRPRSSCGA